MSWAARRRFIILLIIGAVVVSFLSTVLIATFYQTPTCSDTVQNQNENGIDCGGPCPYLCSADEQSPTVLFAKAINNGTGRVDVIASVENRNATSGAKNISYKVQLYGADQVLIHEVTGTFDLAPGATEPVFIPGVTSGKQVVANTFLIIEPSSIQWVHMNGDPRVVPQVPSVKQIGTLNAPRIEAILVNPTATALNDVQAIVIVRDENKEVIAASATIVALIPAQSQAPATFTWNSAFSGIVASIEVRPLVPLP